MQDLSLIHISDTPNSSSHAFTRSFNSNTLNSLIASINSAVVNFAMIIDAIKELSVLELNDLVKACEEEFGVSAAARCV